MAGRVRNDAARSQAAVDDPGNAKQAARDTADEVKAVGRDALEEARQVASDAKERAEEEVDHRASQAADRLSAVVRALESSADQLDDEGERWLAGYARDAARQVDRVTGYLRDEDAGALVHDLEDLARSRPGTFLGTTFAAGVALGRFLRSSTPERADSGDGESYYARPDYEPHATQGTVRVSNHATDMTGAAPVPESSAMRTDPEVR